MHFPGTKLKFMIRKGSQSLIEELDRVDGRVDRSAAIVPALFLRLLMTELLSARVLEHIVSLFSERSTRIFLLKIGFIQNSIVVFDWLKDYLRTKKEFSDARVRLACSERIGLFVKLYLLVLAFTLEAAERFVETSARCAARGTSTTAITETATSLMKKEKNKLVKVGEEIRLSKTYATTSAISESAATLKKAMKEGKIIKMCPRRVKVQ